MDALRKTLEHQLSALPDVRVDLFKDTELVCVFHKDKDFAHFHGARVLDIRLTPKIIRDHGLSRDVSAEFHPKRSKNSRWICIEFKDEADVQDLVELVRLACAL